MENKIRQILKLGICAPSGENCQPWRFQIDREKINIFNLPERDKSLYSWGQRSSYVAHGALIENIAIAAKEFGYEPAVTLFPDSSNDNFIATILLKKGSPAKDPLFSEITKRCTNRKAYADKPLSEEQAQALLASVSTFQDVGVDMVTEVEKIKSLAQATSQNEKIIFENHSLHDFFFNHINWTKEEDAKKSVGFYIETLELPPPAKGAFKLIKYWPILSLLNKIGFSKVVAKDNAKIHGKASAHALFSILNDRKENFIAAGRALERFWLTAGKLGLAIQPMTGIFYLNLQIKNGNASSFSPLQKQTLESTFKTITQFYPSAKPVTAMYLRLGFSDAPSANASRLGPEIAEL